jgi:hypothetical protein
MVKREKAKVIFNRYLMALKQGRIRPAHNRDELENESAENGYDGKELGGRFSNEESSKDKVEVV